MTYYELFSKLLDNGYASRPCGQHMEGGYCCAKAVYEFYYDHSNDLAVAEEYLSHFLDLDARQVFLTWFTEQDAIWEREFPDETILRPLRPSYAAMTDAFIAYRDGKAERIVDFLRKTP